DLLKQDEPVVIVMTDKATVELPAPKPGKLAKCYLKPGEKAILNKPLYDIEITSELQTPKEEVVPVQVSVSPPKKKEKAKPKSQKVLATPVTRKIARDLGIDLTSISGSGKDGRILTEDLGHHSRAALAQTLHLSDDTVKPVIGIHALMAKKMEESKS